jgi:hypothetical protein
MQFSQAVDVSRVVCGFSLNHGVIVEDLAVTNKFLALTKA